MKHISTTPFGRRPDAAGYSAHRALADAPCPAMPIDKWAVLRELGVARRTFRITDRDLQVLQALLSFLPGQELSADAPTIVFPSNATLAGRLHGMPESTLRRHLAALVSAGLILRHDSPNGKRFARRGEAGQITRAFGFDLRPLLVRATEIAAAADDARAREAERHNLRETAVLHLRDAERLIPDQEIMLKERLAHLKRLLRRKIGLTETRHLAVEAAHLAHDANTLTPVVPYESSGNDSQNERHIQNSDKALSESKSHEKDAETIPLQTILSACTESALYAGAPMTGWSDVTRTATRICPMMGITPDVWHHAKRSMGLQNAATAVLCILQRFDRIARPGAYLRSLAQKAESGRFRVEAMVMALRASSPC